MPPQSNHTRPAQEQPCTPPEQPRMLPWSKHAAAPEATTHTPPGATTHAPQATMHAPPGATTHAPPVNRMTNRCKNITLPQTSFAGGN